MATQSGVKLQALSWEKENWENVIPNVKHAFQILSNNTSKVQSWSAKIEEKLQEHESTTEKLDSRMAKAENAAASVERQLQELVSEVRTMKENEAHQFETFHSCIQESLEVSHVFIENFIKTFDGGWIGSTDSLVDHDSSVCETGADLGSVEGLRSLSQRLASQRPKALIAFDAWRDWRAALDEKGEDLMSKSAALKRTSEDIWQRMMQWRTLLQENTHLLEHLGNGLANAQGDIRTLQSTRVAHEHLDAAIFEKSEEMDKLRALVEQRVVDAVRQVDSKLSESEASVGNMERQLVEKVSELNLNMKSMLEQSLNPMNAYLNTMHVGASTMRMEIDDLSTKCSSLQTRIQTVVDQLQSCEELGKRQESKFDGRLELLAHETHEGVQKVAQARADLQTSITEIQDQVSMQMQELQHKLENDSEAIDVLKKSDLPKITREFLELEQKVAKWIRTETMPGKINEARLYALESRLAHEMESRLQLEEFTRERVVSQLSLVTSAVSNSAPLSNGHVALPPVSRHTPRTDEGSFQVHKHVAKQASVRRDPRPSPRSSMSNKKSGSLALELCLA